MLFLVLGQVVMWLKNKVVLVENCSRGAISSPDSQAGQTCGMSCTRVQVDFLRAHFL